MHSEKCIVRIMGTRSFSIQTSELRLLNLNLAAIAGPFNMAKIIFLALAVEFLSRVSNPNISLCSIHSVDQSSNAIILLRCTHAWRAVILQHKVTA
jgi:hypothetical protein